MRILNYFQSVLLMLGDFSIFVMDTICSFRFLLRRRGLFLSQCLFIGVDSLLVCTAAAFFMGAVLGYQLYISLHQFGAESLIGGTVGVALFRELAPVMTGIMVTGRAGAAMAAEISTMKISEQVDALEVMAIDPIEYLVAPRIASALLTVPILALYFTVVATAASALTACGVLGLQSIIFWNHFTKIVDTTDLLHLMVKSGAFGLVLAWVGCFCGMRAHGGARAVGSATRTTVVSAFLVILLCDYILTSILPFGFRKLKVM